MLKCFGSVKKLLVIAVVLYLMCKVIGACSGPEAERRGETKHLLNRVWVDKMPKTKRDPVMHFVLVNAGTKKGGAVGVASKYFLQVEQLDYRVKRGKLELDFIQRNAKAKLKARTWQCKDAPKPFNLCLELSDGKRKLRLYSRSLWRFDDIDDIDALEGLSESLAPRFESLAESAAAAEACPSCDREADLSGLGL